MQLNKVKTYRWTQNGSWFKVVLNFHYNTIVVLCNGFTIMQIQGDRELLDHYEKQLICKGKMII